MTTMTTTMNMRTLMTLRMVTMMITRGCSLNHRASVRKICKV